MDYRRFQPQRFARHLISTPFIWFPLPFFLMLDLVASFYQAVCFPLYGLEKVKHSSYIMIKDRAKLAYLTPLEKLDCMYCGYANGVLLYLKEIAGRTEKYWCGIMHEGKPGFIPHADQAAAGFSRFGDETEFKEKYGA